MPKVSKQTAAQVDDFGVAEDRHEDLDGYRVNFVSIRQSHDLAPMLEALPGGNCPCPHWGYLVKGRLIVRYGDHEEVIEAATPSTVAGTRARSGSGNRVHPVQPGQGSGGHYRCHQEGHVP